MFELYVNGKPYEKFSCLANAMQEAVDRSLWADCMAADVISIETGEIVFSFHKGIPVIISCEIYYIP